MKCHLSRHEKHCRKGEKLICDVCGKYQTNRTDNMKRHRLVCLKRLTKGIFDEDSSFSHSSRVSNHSVVSGDIRIPPPPPTVPSMSGCNGQRRRRNVNKTLSKSFPCDICGRPHGNMSELREHRNVHSSVITGMPTALRNDFASITLSKYAFGGHACEYDLMSHEPCSDVMQFFSNVSRLG